MKTLFMEKIKNMGLKIDEYQLEQFKIYYETLVEWNSKINLTSLTDKADVYQKHFYDSIWLSKIIQLDEQKILDVGSGAGFPSIPLKIMFPNLNITIIDSLNKRITFLRKLTQKLNLDVELIHGRIEDYKIKETYDIVTARAVASLAVLSEFCMPFVKINGLFLPMKSGEVETELNEAKSGIKILGGTIEKTYYYDYDDMKRSIPVIVKIKKTSNIYPRSYNKIKKAPLK